MTYQHLSSDEVQYIRDNMGKLSDGRIAEWIGCNVCTVYYHRTKFGADSYSKRWTDDMKDKFVKDANRMTRKELCRLYNMQPKNVYYRLNLLRREGYDIERRRRC